MRVAGACNQAPNAAVAYPDGREVLHTRLDTLDQTSAMLAAALGVYVCSCTCACVRV